MMYLGSHSCGLLGIPDEVIASGGAPVTWTVDADSGVDMPISAAEYADWITARSFTSPFPVPGSLWRMNEPGPSDHLADSIGARTATRQGTPTYAVDVTGWATNGIRCTLDSGTQWFQFAGENLAFDSVAMFGLFSMNSAPATVARLFSLGGTSAANCVEVLQTSTGAIRGALGANVATTTGTFNTGDVFSVLAVLQPGGFSYGVYVKPFGGSIETLNPSWTAPGSGTVYLGTGFGVATNCTMMRFEYWTGADADAITPTTAAEFFAARGL